MLLQQSSVAQTRKPWLMVPQPKGRRLPRFSMEWLKWLLSLVLGLGLGVVVAGASTMSTERMVMVVIVMLAPFMLLIAGGIRRPLLAIAMIETALDITWYVNFQQPDKGQISGYTVSLTTMALCGLYALWLAELLARRAELPKGLLRIALPFICYVLLASVTALWAPSVKFATFEIYQISHALLLFIYLAANIRTREDVYFVIAMLGLGIVIQSFGQFYVFTTGKNINIGQLTTGAANTYVKEFQQRPGGFIGSPIDAAGLYELYIPALLAFLLVKTNKFYPWVVFGCLGMGMLGLALAQSRMGWMVILLSCAIVCFFAWRRGSLPMWIPIVAAMGAVVFLFAFKDVLLGRFTQDDNGSAHSRVVMTQLGLQVLHDHPIFGIGINNFAAVVKDYLTPEFGQEWFYAIHDKYLLLWVEVGLPGLLAFVWFLLTTLYRSWQVWQRRDPQLAMLGLALGAGIFGQMLHMFVDVFHSKPQVQALWIACGLIAAIYHNMNTNPPEAALVEETTPP
ncbi:MAG: O-antigen ligase family protein [Caldilineaceae bacterium]